MEDSNLIYKKYRAWSEVMKEYIVEDFHIMGEFVLFNGFDQFVSENWKEFSKLYEQRLLATNDFVIEQFLWMQGRNSKNKLVDLYENDIVQVIYKKEFVLYTGKLYFSPLHGVSILVPENNNSNFSVSWNTIQQIKCSLRLIGNIHQNLDLV